MDTNEHEREGESWQLRHPRMVEVLEWLALKCPIAITPGFKPIEFWALQALKELYGQQGYLSISGIQRRLNIGYLPAAQIQSWVRDMTKLERFNSVDPQITQRAEEVQGNVVSNTLKDIKQLQSLMLRHEGVLRISMVCDELRCTSERALILLDFLTAVGVVVQKMSGSIPRWEARMSDKGRDLPDFGEVEIPPEVVASAHRFVKGNVVSAGDLTLLEDFDLPGGRSDFVKVPWAAFVPVPRVLVIEFASEEDVREAMDAGLCRFSVFGEERESRKVTEEHVKEKES